jgi:hypothetical protein
MIVQELEHEIGTTDAQRPRLAELDRMDARLNQLDAELNERQTALRALPRTETDGVLAAGKLSAKHKAIKADIDRLRGELKRTNAEHRALETETDAAFNPHWGPLFREGYEISKFAEQVEAYACVYTSRVSNLRFYSPMQYFRGPRDRMPHERGL